MNTVWQIIWIYLALGIVVLVIFDLITKRIRNGIKTASAETSIKLATGSKTSLLVFVMIMWATWPVVLYGAIEAGIRNRKKNEK